MHFKWIAVSLVLSGMIIFSACDESLPPYEQPQNALAITDVFPAQGLVDPGIEILNIYITGMNLYEETFDDTVNVQGEVRIWWKRHPEITATLPLSNGNFVPPTPIRGSRLTLETNDLFYMKTVWSLYTDDGQYLIDLLNFSAHDVRGDYEYAKTETLVIEVELLVFRQIGMIRAEPVEYEFVGFRRVGGGLE